MGIGLYLVRYFVNKMGGRLTVDSVVNRGTTFRIELPVSHAVEGGDEDSDSFIVIPSELSTVLSSQISPRRPSAEMPTRCLSSAGPGNRLKSASAGAPGESAVTMQDSTKERRRPEPVSSLTAIRRY